MTYRNRDTLRRASVRLDVVTVTLLSDALKKDEKKPTQLPDITVDWTMHAKQRNPSRIQAQDVAQKGPGCDAKMCLTRPSNPLKTLGPEPRLVCFIQRSNPRQTLLPHPRQPCSGRLRPRLAGISGPRKHGLNDACETAKPQQDSSPRRGPKRSRMRRQGVPNPTFEPVKNFRTGASAGMLHPRFKPYTDTLTTPSAAVQWTTSASVRLNVRTPRTWTERCMRNSETPAGFKPKTWPKKVPDATPRCA